MSNLVWDDELERVCQRHARALVRRMRGAVELDDALQEARAIAWETAPKWDGSGDRSGYVAMHISWRYVDWLRKDGFYSRHEFVRRRKAGESTDVRSLDWTSHGPLNDYEGIPDSDLYAQAQLAYEDPGFEEVEVEVLKQWFIRVAKERLTRSEQYVLQEGMLGGRALKDVGSDPVYPSGAVSESRVCQIQASARRKLRRELQQAAA